MTEELYHIIELRHAKPLGRYYLPSLEPMPKPVKRTRFEDNFMVDQVIHEESIPVEPPVIRRSVLSRELRKLVRKLKRDKAWMLRQGDKSGAQELDGYIELAQAIADRTGTSPSGR